MIRSMSRARTASLSFVLLAGCHAGAPIGALDASAATGPGVPDLAVGPAVDLASPRDETPLEVRFLGVGGFLMRRGADAVMTAPLYSNPALLELPAIASRPDRVAQFTAGLPLADVRAVLVGHAHYDHLLDVPTVLPLLQPGAVIYGNRTMKHLLAAFFPDRSARCASAAPAYSIPRERVFAFDDLDHDRVDRRVCAGGGSSAGEWVAVPGANVRVRALCSQHPPQLAFYHFGEGSIDADLCDPPADAQDWREGQTLAYLIDFLDGGAPAYRLYYQDAPTPAPIGHVPADVLAEKRVDAALLCVGNYDQVPDQPGAILAALAPRYTIGGHWEGFFQPQDAPLQPLPFHDIAEYARRGDAALGAGGEAPIAVNGQPTAKRSFVPDPGTTFVIARTAP